MKTTLDKQLVELLQQMLETERGGVKIYETALQCVQNKDLRKEFEEYHEQTQKHVTIMRELFGKLGLAEEETPGTKVVGHIGESLVLVNPVWGAIGDLRMCWLALRGRLAVELRRNQALDDPRGVKQGSAAPARR